VLELSSFQLQFARSFAADAATVLNLSQDHLDWHLDGAEYQGAKAKIFGAKTIQILNRDDANVMAMAQADHAQHSFGLNKPAQAHAYGLWQDGSVEWLCVANVLANEQPQTKANKANPPEVVLDVVRVMPVNALRIRGRHNALNALAALALCRAIELPLSKLLHGLRTYAGEPHRVQLIHTIGGVDFYDDSKGTNVGATVAAISGLDQPIILIAGGDGKGQDFAPLAACVQGRVKQIELIGKDAQRLQAALSESGAQITLHDSLELATQAAAHAALTGDVVLLSPACASLDMFKNYAHRAQVFADAVAEFAHQRGQL
jgi:UDP-N-acetylmuramoylalanine--D-glutamate ligase